MNTSTSELSIEATRDPAIFATCAAMMAQTSPWANMGMAYTQCRQAFDGEWRETYVLKQAQEVLGFVVIQPWGTFKGYIQTICIAEQYRGMGLGKKLLRFCEDTILPYSPNLFICVSTFNTGAIKLYTDFGFQLVGELPDFVKAGFTELLLRKTVGPMIR